MKIDWTKIQIIDEMAPLDMQKVRRVLRSYNLKNRTVIVAEKGKRDWTKFINLKKEI